MKPTLSHALFTIGLVSLITSFFIVSIGSAQWTLWPFDGKASSSSSSSSSLSIPSSTGMDSASFGSTEEQTVRVVQQAEPAVVSVIISEELPVLQQEMQTIPSPFGDQFNFQVPRMVQKGTQLQEVGGGTAFFVSSDGLLLTNKHVVSDTNAQYTVLLNDGRKVPATVVARDPSSDIALIKVEGSGFTPLTVASTDNLKLGQTAIAIGNALGEFRNTVSVGVISGLSRSITAGAGNGGGVEQLEQIIQTDAAINRGNSGGPLLNSRGEVIGMNTAVASDAQNIGFAIPAPELRRALESFTKNGHIVRPYLGVRYAPITPALQSTNKLAFGTGVLVVHGDAVSDVAVLPGSPAEKAGLKEGDIILEADGITLTPDTSLAHIVQTKQPGDTLLLKIARDGKVMDVKVVVEEKK